MNRWGSWGIPTLSKSFVIALPFCAPYHTKVSAFDDIRIKVVAWQVPTAGIVACCGRLHLSEPFRGTSYPLSFEHVPALVIVSVTSSPQTSHDIANSRKRSPVNFSVVESTILE
jgi:hypothetical protein